MITHRAGESVYSPLSAMVWVVCLRRGLGRYGWFANFWIDPSLSNRIGTADSDLNRISKLCRSLSHKCYYVCSGDICCCVRNFLEFPCMCALLDFISYDCWIFYHVIFPFWFLHSLIFCLFQWCNFCRLSLLLSEIFSYICFCHMAQCMCENEANTCFLYRSSENCGVSLVIWDHTVLPASQHKWTLNTPAITQARQTSIRFTYPEGIEGWVDLGGWLQLRWFTCPHAWKY